MAHEKEKKKDKVFNFGLKKAESGTAMKKWLGLRSTFWGLEFPFFG